VESVFESFSIKVGVGSDEHREVTRANAILAYEEILKMWKV